MQLTQEFPGIHPQKFKGGRIHLKPQDCIGRDFNLGELELRGKKHFSFGTTPVMEYKSCLKVGYPKNVTNPEILFTYKSEGGPKKLTYMPPIKKVKEFRSVRIRVDNDREAEEEQNENRRMVEQLDQWEQRILRKKK